jgi:hypothetical protein
VAIDISSSEPLIPLSQAAESLGVCSMTVWRWVRRGAKDPKGRIVRLPAIRAGGKWLTTKTALKKFIDGLTRKFEREVVHA